MRRIYKCAVGAALALGVAYVVSAKWRCSNDDRQVALPHDDQVPSDHPKSINVSWRVGYTDPAQAERLGRKGPSEMIVTMSDPKDVAQFMSFFPDINNTKVDPPSAWGGTFNAVLVYDNKNTIAILSDLKNWSRGAGLWSVAPGFDSFLVQLFTSDRYRDKIVWKSLGD